MYIGTDFENIIPLFIKKNESYKMEMHSVSPASLLFILNLIKFKNLKWIHGK